MNELNRGPVLPLMLQKARKDGLDMKEMMDDQTWLREELSKWPSEKVKDLAVDMLLWTKYWPNEAFPGSTTSAPGHAPDTGPSSTVSVLGDSAASIEMRPVGALTVAHPAHSIVQDQGGKSLTQVTFPAEDTTQVIKADGWKGIKRKREESTGNPALMARAPKQAAAEVMVSGLLDFRHPRRFSLSPGTKKVTASENLMEERYNHANSSK